MHFLKGCNLQPNCHVKGVWNTGSAINGRDYQVKKITYLNIPFFFKWSLNEAQECILNYSFTEMNNVCQEETDTSAEVSTGWCEIRDSSQHSSNFFYHSVSKFYHKFFFSFPRMTWKNFWDLARSLLTFIWFLNLLQYQVIKQFWQQGRIVVFFLNFYAFIYIIKWEH